MLNVSFVSLFKSRSKNDSQDVAIDWSARASTPLSQSGGVFCGNRPGVSVFEAKFQTEPLALPLETGINTQRRFGSTPHLQQS